MENTPEMENGSNSIRPEGSNRSSPPGTPAPDPVEQNDTLTDQEEGTGNETIKPLIEKKGKEKAKKEKDATDGKKKKKRRHHRPKEGEAEGAEEGGSNRKKKRKRRKKHADGDGDKKHEENETQHNEGDALIAIQYDVEKNPYQPTVQYAKNGIQSTSLEISAEKYEKSEEEEVEIREINSAMVTRYTIFAILAIALFFPLGIPAMVFALNSQSALRRGEEEGAYHLIKRSKLFSQIASVAGFLMFVLIAILVMVSFMS